MFTELKLMKDLRSVVFCTHTNCTLAGLVTYVGEASKAM